MKPAAFEYHRVHSVTGALERLSELGDGAKPIAGGQSLVPMMNMRLARPTALVDIGRLSELSGIDATDDWLRIGALTVHAAVERADLARGFAVLREAAGSIGHYPIRARGTFGGSIAHADPVAEWCLLAVALDADIVMRGPAGVRRLPAELFFEGYFTTALDPGELVVRIDFPRPRPHAAMRQFARRAGDFAVVAAAVALDLEEGRCSDPRVVVGGVDDVPLRVAQAESVLDSEAPDDALLAEAGRVAAAAIEPVSDGMAPAAYRRQLTDVLVRAALADALHHPGWGQP